MKRVAVGAEHEHRHLRRNARRVVLAAQPVEQPEGLPVDVSDDQVRRHVPERSLGVIAVIGLVNGEAVSREVVGQEPADPRVFLGE